MWWVRDKSDSDEHTTPVQARLCTYLSTEEKTRLRAEAALLCPSIVKFFAGSVANPKNDDEGGIYIERALKLIESEMKEAGLRMDDPRYERRRIFRAGAVP